MSICSWFGGVKGGLALSWSASTGRGTAQFSNLSFVRRVTVKASRSQSMKFGLK